MPCNNAKTGVNVHSYCSEMGGRAFQLLEYHIIDYISTNHMIGEAGG